LSPSGSACATSLRTRDVPSQIVREIEPARDLQIPINMSIEVLGIICCGWTALEVTRLVVRGIRAPKVGTSSSHQFGAWDGRGDAIDVEVVD
jgi:hypothetical protein